ncbi:MAG: hypothetical protein HYT62_01745 [Candidatus Yanofskybacteria bacterium]|nr:hypothetical protein [Candidatus Yanofskybacteria bacterium]
MRITSVRESKKGFVITVVQEGRSTTFHLHGTTDAYGRQWNVLDGTFTVRTPENVDSLDPRPGPAPKTEEVTTVTAE